MNETYIGTLRFMHDKWAFHHSDYGFYPVCHSDAKKLSYYDTPDLTDPDGYNGKKVQVMLTQQPKASVGTFNVPIEWEPCVQILWTRNANDDLTPIIEDGTSFWNEFVKFYTDVLFENILNDNPLTGEDYEKWFAEKMNARYILKKK